ncbi:polyunsaturated fatty acid lipoxygenase ALOX15B-like [Astyanax mexicanus]|uniref:polyunsaturated fatty acid lipoxygenase ALOX15B-like n=1 Tax=Astyanax mexicanus TaxID=7994 RepID=UPI0020CB3727|nr:polyunsaturated fatty acid lipoxygenase ALOX15B-like [Astyanax mexicanus]
MVEYKVEVFDSTVLTLDTIYIRLIGSICNSEPQVLHSPLSLLLLDNDLYIKQEFHAQTISFLGFVVSHNTLRMVPTKVKVVQNWPRQTSVDSSEVGVGAVLSQQVGLDGRLHPCAYYSHCLSPVEQRYDVGDGELLAVKLALEEWRHWLEGAEHPFLVWTDHKNLAYIQQAKCLNPRQARWGLPPERTVTTVCCDNNVGTVLLVELEATPCFLHFFKDWFCAKLVVTTPEGDEVVFPCYQWLDSKKPIVSLRNSKATLVQKETEIALHFQRRQELKERQQNFRYGGKIMIYPPALMQIQRLICRVRLAELELESLMACSESWRSFNQLQSILRHPEPNKAGAYVQQHWQEDEFFGYQTLNGLNPMLIELCTKLPRNFPVTNTMVRSSLEGSSLKTEMKKGNIFLCDYKRLSGFKGSMIDGKQQYLAAPLCLLYSTPEKTLKPIAIQLQQKPNRNNPIFLPTDSQWDWLLAKIFVRNAEFHEHELNFHLLRTHLLAEVFTIATLRNLPSAHPLYKLLKPHTLYTLQINIMARNLLISPGGVFDKYTSIGHAVRAYLPKAFSTLTYSSLCLPDNIKERGLENIPDYFYREQAQKLWNIINKYVDGVVKYYYLSAEDVQKDSELQDWISEIFNFGFLGREQSGIPKSFSTVDELIKFVTMVIFTVSAQHAAVNNGQFDFGGWMPNLPTALRLPPQCKKGVTTEKTIFQALPNVTTTIHGMAVLYLLSRKSSDHYLLGNFREELFSEAVPRGHIKEFQKALKLLEAEDKTRNQSLEPGYPYLNPTTVDNSVAL